MPNPVHLRMRLSGHLYTDSGSWSIGLNFGGTDGFDIGGLGGAEAKLQSWSDAVRALHSNQIIPSSLQEILSSAGSITALRCALIGTDGKEQATAVTEFSTSIKGTGSPVHTHQIAMALSLDSGRPGSSYRGRIYWPALAVPVGIGGQASGGLIGPIATDTAAWLRDLAGAGASVFSPGLTPIVVSTTKNIASAIEKVRVGSRLDVQRRRADKEKETYGVAVVPQ
jgi:hypothetical protein